MQEKYTLKLLDGILEGRLAGKPAFDDLLADQDEIDSFEKKLKLIDIRNCEVNLESDQVLSIADNSESIHKTFLKQAILVSEDLSFGLGRMYQFYREGRTSTVKVFRDEKRGCYMAERRNRLKTERVFLYEN